MEKHYEERSIIIDRIWIIIGNKNLSQTRIAERLSYSKSKVSRVLSEATPIDLDFILSFADEFCSGDVIYLLTGVSGSIDSFTKKVLDGVPRNEQEKFCNTLLEIARLIKK